MNTPAHVIFSLALLGRGNAGKYAVAIAVGALAPDAFMVLFYAVETLSGTPEQVIWEERYYLPAWQNLFDAANSIPLLLLAMLAAWWRGHRALTLLFASMFIHCLLDLPLHNDDAHRHFFPLSDFRFHSPVSYWDPRFYGHYVLAAEMALFTLATAWLWTTAHGTARALELTRLRTVLLLTTVVYAGFQLFVVIHWWDL